MAIEGYTLEAVGHIGDDFGFVSLDPNLGKDKVPDRVSDFDKTKVMWSASSTYGVIGSKVGDFIDTHGYNTSMLEGIFTHREIAEELMNLFTGLAYQELEWHENPLVHKTKGGKPRKGTPKWLPEREVDLVHLYSPVYIESKEPQEITTDFFTVNRTVSYGINSWLMCTKEVYEKLKERNYTCLELRPARIA